MATCMADASGCCHSRCRQLQGAPHMAGRSGCCEPKIARHYAWLVQKWALPLFGMTCCTALMRTGTAFVQAAHGSPVWPLQRVRMALFALELL